MDTINIYLKELENTNSNKEESLLLIEKARKGDSVARERIIKNYLLLVVKVAKNYINMGVPLGDLIGEGNAGLMIALEKFDSTKGAFSTCAKVWIKQSIIRNCMHKKRIVRLPENVSELMRTDRWTGTAHKEISIDTPNDEGDSLSESIPDFSENVNDIYAKESEMLIKRKVENILMYLNNRDADVVKACFGINMEKPIVLEEVATMFNLTTTRINQILRNSLKKMRVTHESLPAAKSKTVEIVSAIYGSGKETVDVTDKVVDLYLRKENIKSCNRLGGDPCNGVSKTLVVQYIYESELLSKSFNEGSLVKF